VILVLGSLFATLVVIYFNTLIHPFTLADNRHYVFYVFRYTILFHPLIRYLLAPVYLLCMYLSYRTLYGPSNPSPSNPSTAAKASPRKSELQQRIQSINQGTPLMESGPTTSLLLIWALSTALCLITTPLVEPRYFIIPWIVWRLHVPDSSSSASSSSIAGKRRGGRRGGFGEWVKGYDYRLWIETFWFLAINAATGYVFLYRGFEWKQEPGNVQRFMW
jgi:alpha-1,2-glucosyltransferase